MAADQDAAASPRTLGKDPVSFDDVEERAQGTGGKSKKKLKRRFPKGTVVVDVANCHYEPVRTVAKNKGWGLLEGEDFFERDSMRYNLFWSDRSVTRTRIRSLGPHQMANHFPGMLALSSKAQLAANLRKMKDLFPDEFNFFPETWSLPDQYGAFMGEIQKQQGQTNKTKLPLFIVKPDRGCQGKNIFLTQTADEDVIKDAFWKLGDVLVAQPYLQNPLLIGGLKFDLRLYVLITSCDPLRVYLYRDGLARFCTQPYTDAGGGADAGWEYAHLTNSTLNKTNASSYTDSTDPSDPERGSKRRMLVLLEHLRAQGHDTEALWGQLRALTAKTCLAVQPLLAYYHRLCRPEDKFGDRCFEVLGLDVLLDADLTPWLLEINHSPSFHSLCSVDAAVKEPLVQDTFGLLQGVLQRRAAATPDRRYTPPGTENPSPLLARMRDSLQRHESGWRKQTLTEFDLDRPRYFPPASERYAWRGRSEAEEAAWSAEQDANDAANSSGYLRCYPPPPEDACLQGAYDAILRGAEAAHQSVLQQHGEGDQASEDEERLRLSDSDDDEAAAPRLDWPRVSQNGTAQLRRTKDATMATSGATMAEDAAPLPGADSKAPSDRWARLVLGCAPLGFGLGIVFPPLMLLLFFLVRRLRARDDEAGVWAGLLKWTLVIQLPICLLLLGLLLRVEYIVSEILSGKNAVPIEEFLKDGGASAAERADKMAAKYWGTEKAVEWMKTASCASAHAANAHSKRNQ